MTNSTYARLRQGNINTHKKDTQKRIIEEGPEMWIQKYKRFY